MSNRYLTLDGSKKISDTYTLIPAGFDKVQQDVDTNKTTADNHIANADIHVTAAKKAEWDSKAPGSTQTELDEHVDNADIHVTAAQKEDWDGKAAGTLQGEFDDHIADTVAHLTQQEHEKLTGIEEGAQKNQNAFAKVNDINASTTTDQFFIVGGIGITITTDPVTKKVTVTATGEATPGPHGSSHDSDGSDPIPDLVELQGVVADQAAEIQASADAAEQALTLAQAAETPDGAQAKADTAKAAAISAAATDATNKADTAESNAVAKSKSYSDNNFYNRSQLENTNIVRNGRGLFGMQDWNNKSQNWTTVSGYVEVGGGYFMPKVEIPEGTHTYIESSDPIQVYEGSTYQFGATFHTLGGLPTDLLRLELVDGTGTQTLATILGDYNKYWHRKTASYTVPPGVNFVKLRIVCTGPITNPQSVIRGVTRVMLAVEADATHYTDAGDFISLFTSVSNGKNAIASAITGKGVPASGSDTFSTLATKIGQISTGSRLSISQYISIIKTTGVTKIVDIPPGKTFAFIPDIDYNSSNYFSGGSYVFAYWDSGAPNNATASIGVGIQKLSGQSYINIFTGAYASNQSPGNHYVMIHGLEISNGANDPTKVEYRYKYINPGVQLAWSAWFVASNLSPTETNSLVFNYNVNLGSSSCYANFNLSGNGYLT
ncbi:hypothetical protein [Paenibacillus cellulositrophicus]|uniref:hypothetical protein n=1 Tax=Paenibacillus cellulositrophicus TaxID=562959 RepID=UPI003D95F3F8